MTIDRAIGPPTATPNALDVLEDDGLIFACLLNGDGSARLLDWEGVLAWTPTDGVLWAHLNLSVPRVQRWVRESSGVTPVTAQAILAEESRPRVFHGKRGYVAMLRGVNTNPGSDPEDMVSLRTWCDGQRLLTLRTRRLLTPRDVLSQLLEDQDGPSTASELFERIVTRLTERMRDAIDSIDQDLDEIEEGIDIEVTASSRSHLNSARRRSVALRRFLAPQREALNAMLLNPPAWLSDHERLGLRETHDRLIGYVEELDAARERALVLKDQLASQLEERMNRNMYLLSIVAAIFLPLSFLTGVLGMNVGGLPGAENSWAFWMTCAVFALILVLELILFRRLKWI